MKERLDDGHIGAAESAAWETSKKEVIYPCCCGMPSFRGFKQMKHERRRNNDGRRRKISFYSPALPRTIGAMYGTERDQSRLSCVWSQSSLGVTERSHPRFNPNSLYSQGHDQRLASPHFGGAAHTGGYHNSGHYYSS